MSDFRGAFKRGVDAAHIAQVQRSEAEGVVADCIHQIREASGDRVRLTLEEANSTLMRFQRLLGGSLMSDFEKPAKPEKDRSYVLVAEARYENSSSAQVPLCWLTFAPGTYPIEAQWETEVLVCNDRAALAGALESMIEDPRTGAKFERLMQAHARLVKGSHQAKRLEEQAQELEVATEELKEHVDSQKEKE